MMHPAISLHFLFCITFRDIHLSLYNTRLAHSILHSKDSQKPLIRSIKIRFNYAKLSMLRIEHGHT